MSEKVTFTLEFGDLNKKLKVDSTTSPKDLVNHAAAKFSLITREVRLQYCDKKNKKWFVVDEDYELIDDDILKLVIVDECGRNIVEGNPSKLNGDGGATPGPTTIPSSNQIETASVKPEEESLLQKSPKQDHVVKLLHEHIYEYDRIGQLLGVDFGTRQRIKLDFTTPTALGKMNSIVNEWSTKQTYDVTWEHFIKAMKDGDFSKLPGEIEGFIERDDIKQEYAKEKEWVDIREPDEGEIMDTSENGVSSSSQGKTTDHLQLDGNPEVYKYPCKSGMVVIIANEKFEGSVECREGTDTDIKKIKKTFAKNNPRVIKDLTADGMKEHLKQLCGSLNSDFINPDYLICFIMSHGNENGVQGVDKSHVTIAELAKTLEADKCTALKGKPKLFFIQACRGNSSPDAVKFDDSRGEQPKDKIVFDGNITAIPPGADFLFGYSTVPNNVSLRREQSGSFYIQILCDMIDKYSSKLSLHDIVMLVHQELATNDKYVFEDKRTKYRQMAEMVSTLRGHVHLK